MPVTRGVRVDVSFEQSSVSDMDPDYVAGEVIDITCGALSAKLHKERFICPGINRECIEYEGRFVTPKTFYVMAEKGSLKDWKNAIRINGIKIRKYIESGELDFYNHKELCTFRCRSRMGHKTSLLPMDQPGLKSYKPETVDNPDTSTAETLQLDSFGEPQDVKPTPVELNQLLINMQPDVNGNRAMSPSSSTVTSDTDGMGSQQMKLQMVQIGQNNDNTDDEDVMFWRAIVQLGLIDEFFREIKSKLDLLKVTMIKQFVPISDAKKASLIVNELGMRSKLDMRLYAHKFEFDRQRAKLEKEMEELKRKVNEYEQKKEILKRKSDCYEQLMNKKPRGDESDVASYTIATPSGRAMLMINGEQLSSLQTGSSSPIFTESQESCATTVDSSASDSHLEACIDSSQSSNATASSSASLNTSN